MAKRIKKIAAIKEALKLIQEHIITVLKIIWLPILLIAVLNYSHAYYLKDQPPHYDSLFIISFVLNKLLCSIFLVALFRLFIQKDTALIKQFDFKRRGLYADKTLFSFPFYLQLGKCELIYTAWDICSNLLFYKLPLFVISSIVNYYHDHSPQVMSDPNFINLVITARGILVTVNLLLIAGISFTFPYLALNTKTTWKGFLEAIKAMKGHLLSIFFVQLLFILPSLVLWNIFRFIESLSSIHSSPEIYRIIINLDQFLSAGLSYVITIVLAAFISILYPVICQDINGKKIAQSESL